MRGKKMKPVRPKITFARNLRRNQTDAEKLLWSKLRNRQLGGIKFRRQYIIHPYIVDFVSIEQKLIVELDGGQHNEQKTKMQDDMRTKYLAEKGYRLLRFWDNDVLKDIEVVLEKIYLTLTLS